jgi:hypothetical protein
MPIAEPRILLQMNAINEKHGAGGEIVVGGGLNIVFQFLICEILHTQCLETYCVIYTAYEN